MGADIVADQEERIYAMRLSTSDVMMKKVLTEEDIQIYCALMCGDLYSFPLIHKDNQRMPELFKDIENKARPLADMIRNKYERLGGAWMIHQVQ